MAQVKMSYANLFPSFPDDAQLWVYSSGAPLSAERQAGLRDAMQEFFGRWQSHGTPVTAAAEIVGDRFLLVAAYIPDGGVSGCGIDASTRALGHAAASQGVEWESALKIFYRASDGRIESVSRPAFRSLVERGVISENDMVFDPSITRVGALRSGAFERPASETWMRRYFSQEGLAAR